MQVNNIQISNGNYGGNKEKAVEIGEGFFRILSGLMEISEEDIVEGILEEDEKESTMEEAMNFLFNMPLMDQRKMMIPTMLEGEDESLEGVESLVNLDEGESWNLREMLSTEEDQVIPEGNIPVEDVELTQGGNEKLQDEIDIDFNSILKEKEEISIPKDEKMIDDTQGKETVKDRDIVQPHRDMEVLKEEEHPVVGRHLDKVELDKFPMEERKIEVGDRELTSIDLIQRQPKMIEPKVDTTLQSNALSVENLEIVNNSMVHLMETSIEEGTSTMKVKLYPEELGSVDITLTMEEGKLIAKILVDNEQVKQLFANSMKELNQNLLRQKIYIGDVQIDLNNNSNGQQHQGGSGYFAPNKRIVFGEKVSDSGPVEERIWGTREISILA